MTLEQVEKALLSLEGWPTKIGIIGGEPILHPQFFDICLLIRKYIPKEKIGLWTSGGPKYQKYLADIQNTFGFVAYNEHNEVQQNTCKHQPLTLAIKDVVDDETIRDKLIDDCWVQRTWCATINHFGAYFCEVAAAQDVLLNAGANAWPVETGWWKRSDFQKQLCQNCGMAIPIERELIKNSVEKFSPTTLELFRAANLRKMDAVAVFDKKLSRAELLENIKYWYPGNYRGDRCPDEQAPEGKGFTKSI